MSFIFSNPNSPQARVQSPPIVAQIDPPTTGPQAQHYPIGTFWINTASDTVFTLTSFANGEATWVSQVSGGGSFSSLTITPGPTAITGEFRVNGNVDEAEVIRLRENGGSSGTIEIASLQGTGADAISIQAAAGGIEIFTDATFPTGNLVISTDGGAQLSLGSTADETDGLLINMNGGITSSIGIINNTGTNTAFSPATASIHIISDLGGIAVESGIDYQLTADTNATITATNGDIALTAAAGDVDATATLGDINILADAGDINIEATLGALNFTAGGGISYSVTGSIDLDATETSHFKVTGVSEDLQLQSVGGSVALLADEAVADAIVISATGASAGIQIAPAATVASVAIANVIPTVARTVTVSGGTVGSAVADTLNLGTGATSFAGASKVVNIATSNNLLGTDTVNISTGTSATGTKSVNIGNLDGLTAITAYGDTSINTSTSDGDTTIGNKTAGGAVNIYSLTSIDLDPVTTLTMAPTATVTTIDLGNITPTVNRATTINGGAVIAAHSDTLNLATGGINTSAGASKVVNVATGANLLGTTTVNVASGNAASGTHAVNIATGTGGGTKTVAIGNVDGLTAITALGDVNINTSSNGDTIIGSKATGGQVTLSSLTDITLDPVNSLTMAPTATVQTIALGDITPTVNRTTTINGGAVIAAHTDTLNLATGGVNTNAAAVKVVNIASGDTATGSQTVNIASGTNALGSAVTVNISTGTGGGTKLVDIGNADNLTTMSFVGPFNLNEQSAATGAISIGNSTAGGAIALATNTAIGLDSKTASHFTVTGAADLTLRSTAGSVVVSSSLASASAIQLTTSDAAGGVTSNHGITISTATYGLTLPGGQKVISGAGSPNASVTAAKGSLYLRSDGSGVNDRMYVNTDSATAWTAVVTVA